MPIRDGATVRLTLLAVIGVAFGMCASFADHSSFVMLSKVTGVGWSWGALGIATAALTRHRPVRAVLLVLVCAVAGYYLTVLAIGGYNDTDFTDPATLADPTLAPVTVNWTAPLDNIAFWSAGAAILCWPLAQIGTATHRPDGWGLAARIAIPVGAAIENLALRLPSELAIQPSPVTVATQTGVGALSLAAILVLVAHHIRHRNTRSETAAT
jgi:hypothetical protein